MDFYLSQFLGSEKWKKRECEGCPFEKEEEERRDKEAVLEREKSEANERGEREEERRDEEREKEQKCE